MSHFTSIQTQIKDVDALRSAVEELGLTLLPDAQARGYYQNWLRAAACPLLDEYVLPSSDSV